MSTDFGASRTFKNLAATFASECQEGAKYQFMAKMAERQKLLALQMHLKILAKEEMAHAERAFDLLITHSSSSKTAKAEIGTIDGVVINASYPFKGGSLLEILMFTSDAEKHQQDVVYKEFFKTAKSEGYDEIAIFFNELATVEGCHASLLDEFCTMLKKGTLYKMPQKTKWKCSSCGYEKEEKEAPEVCNLCKAPQGAHYIKSSMYNYFKP